jgi:hypothetical protein
MDKFHGLFLFDQMVNIRQAESAVTFFWKGLQIGSQEEEGHEKQPTNHHKPRGG